MFLVPPDCKIYFNDNMFGLLSPSSGSFVYTRVRISEFDSLGVGRLFFYCPNLKPSFEEINTIKQM